MAIMRGLPEFCRNCELLPEQAGSVYDWEELGVEIADQPVRICPALALEVYHRVLSTELLELVGNDLDRLQAVFGEDENGAPLQEAMTPIVQTIRVQDEELVTKAETCAAAVALGDLTHVESVAPFPLLRGEVEAIVLMSQLTLDEVDIQ